MSLSRVSQSVAIWDVKGMLEDSHAGNTVPLLEESHPIDETNSVRAGFGLLMMLRSRFLDWIVPVLFS